MEAPNPTPMDKKHYVIYKNSIRYKLTLSSSSGSLELQLETLGQF